MQRTEKREILIRAGEREEEGGGEHRDTEEEARGRGRAASSVSFPLFEIFNECSCSLEILTFFPHRLRGQTGAEVVPSFK